jgi:hypothetical protein
MGSGLSRGVAAVLVTAAALLAAPVAGGLAPPTAWNGTNPFRCELQQAGFGPVGPHPEADPYCIEFDKRRQNVTELGVVEFLSQEPGRTAAAVPKCFYFQSDHWRGSIVQSDGSTKTYEWDGHYFFDKARAEGGAWVTNFNINGQSFDPSEIPGIPPEYAATLGRGTGGVITHNDIPADPTCAARARAHPELIYAAAAPGSGAAPRPCAVPGRLAPRGLGPATLGELETVLRERLGEPAAVERGYLRYCLRGGGALFAGVPGDRSGERGVSSTGAVRVLLTTSRSPRLRGIGVGATLARVQRAFPALVGRAGGAVTTWHKPSPRSPYLLAVRRGRVRALGVYATERIRSRAALAAWLARVQV